MLKEVLVVEGKMDTVAIKRALEADTIETGGFNLAPHTLRQIEAAYKKRGIIILTDPDGAGERIRRFLTQRFPEAGQAFVPKADATAHNDVALNRLSQTLFWQPLPKCAITNTALSTNFAAATCGRTIWPEQAVRRIAVIKWALCLASATATPKGF